MQPSQSIDTVSKLAHGAFWIMARRVTLVAAGVDRIEVTQTFANFRSSLVTTACGVYSSTLMLASLPALERDAVQRTMEARFPSTEAGIRITGEALVVRGRA